MTRILVIDDDVDFSEWLRIQLETNINYIVDVVNSYEEGLAKIQECSHDLYLIDYLLDNRHDGLDLIHKGHKLGLVSLIMLTSKNDNELANIVISDGGCDFLTKTSLNTTILHRAIINNLARAKHLHQLLEERSRLLQKVQYDQLTGLLSRSNIIEQLAQQIENNSNNFTAIMYLDLDGFKKINDIHGHAAGDDLLKQVATRLVSRAWENDIVARLSGDEFLICLSPKCDENNLHVAAAITASKIIRTINQPFKILCAKTSNSETVTVSASIGVAIYPNDSKDCKELIKLADQAMYEAKTSGKNQFAFCHSSQSLKIA